MIYFCSQSPLRRHEFTMHAVNLYRRKLLCDTSHLISLTPYGCMRLRHGWHGSPLLPAILLLFNSTSARCNLSPPNSPRLNRSVKLSSPPAFCCSRANTTRL